MAVSHPQRFGELLGKVYRLVADGRCRYPRQPFTRCPTRPTAIRVMGAAEHTGKLVLDVPHTGKSNVVVPPEQARSSARDGSYIVTGGLGGLGLFLAEKMASARAAAVASCCLPIGARPRRSTRSSSSGRWAATSWWSAATSPQPGTADRLVAAATATGLPLRGVLHAAGVVEDATLENITDELIDRDWAPKVYGAWNLHHGHRGTRRSTGSARSPRPRRWWARRAGRVCRGQQLARRVHPLAAGSRPSRDRRSHGEPGPTSAARRTRQKPPTPRSLRTRAPTRSRRCFATTAPTPATHPSPECPGSPRWRNAPSSPKCSSARAKLNGNKQIARRAAGVARRRNGPPGSAVWSPTRSPGSCAAPSIRTVRCRYGLDSLGNLELRTRLEAETGIRITSTDITTIQGLAGLLCEKLT